MQDNSKLVKSRLRALRKQRKLNQRDIADFLGTTVATYSRYEKGLFKLDSGLLCKMAEYYDVSVDYILMRTNDPCLCRVKSDSYIDFYIKYDSLDTGKKELLAAIADAMKRNMAEQLSVQSLDSHNI